jgi:hypothetical protein
MFKERDIENSYDLAKCILMCRFIRTAKLIILLGVVLYGLQDFNLLGSNTAIALIVTTAIALLAIDGVSHYSLLTKDKEAEDFKYSKTLKASIWQLYKCDAKTLSDEAVIKYFKEK